MNATAEERLATRRELQDLIRRIEQRPAPRRRPIDAPHRPSLIWLDSDAGRIGYRELRYGTDEVVGTQPLAPLFEVDARSLHLLSRGDVSVGAPGTSARDLVFFDIETTGLGGAGAAVFMVAVARIEGADLILRQYVSPSPADEAVLVDAVVGTLALDADPVLVSYNGLSFDAPFVDERATLHRRRSGLQSARHLDLLHTVRRGYRGMLRSHRLATVEAELLRVTRPDLEVGGAEVPAWYFRFVRSGSMRFLEPLLDHNAVDVLSLAGLVAHLHEGISGAPDAPRSLAIGRLAQAARSYEVAERHLRLAVWGIDRRLVRDEAMRALAVVCRALGRREDALPELRWLAEHSAEHRNWAREQLAIYYEHHARDHREALAQVEAAWTSQSPGDAAAWERRYERLRQKLAG